MTIAIMQPYLLPYIGYFHLIKAVDTFIILDDVSYITRGWINRNRILSQTGSDYLFTLPLHKASRNRQIKDLQISDQYHRWRRRFMNQLHHTYGKAPQFTGRSSLLEELFPLKKKSLIDLLEHQIITLAAQWELNTSFCRSSNISTKNLTGEKYIITIALQREACIYINLPGGKKLYHPEVFSNHGISLGFIKSNQIIYDQGLEKFIPWLSILDVMMFNDDDSLKKQLSSFSISFPNLTREDP